MPSLNQEGIDLIKSFESLDLEAYPDPGTKNDPIKKGDPWTIGYGTTIYSNGTKVKKGDKITREQAENYFTYDVTKFSKAVYDLIKRPLTDNQFSALVSFTYNLGIGNLKASTLLKKVNSNPNDPTIANEFPKWNKANGKVLNGLVRRRAAESALYFKK